MDGQHATHGQLTRATHDALLAHLLREKDWLRAARESLLAVRRVVVTGDVALLEEALREQDRLEAERQELSAKRPEIFGQAAVQLGLDAGSATLGGIAARLSPQARQPMMAARRELLSRARSMRMLAGGAMSAVVRHRQLVDGLLSDLLGTSPSETRYTAEGHRHEVAGRSLVECRT